LPKYFTRQRVDATNLVVLDREEHEALRVLLEKWLISFFWLDRGCNCYNCLLCLDLLDDGFLDLDVVNDWRVGIEGYVLLVNDLEVELLGRRVTHLQALNGRCSL
jgi:hypothetical protein